MNKETLPENTTEQHSADEDLSAQPSTFDTVFLRKSGTRPTHHIYDQTTYIGRLCYFAALTNPKNLLLSDKEIECAQNVIKSAPTGAVAEEQVQYAQLPNSLVLNSVLHPDTGEKVFWPFRMSAFVPINLLVTAGLLIPSPTTLTIIFWQWLNQSLNVTLNWANANKSSPMASSEIMLGYASAVGASCTVAIGLNRLARRASTTAPIIRGLLTRTTPFLAVATAGALNVFLMRRNEIRDGIDVLDEHGNTVGKSKKAAEHALAQTAFSRIATAFPVLTIPPLVVSMLEKHRFFRARPLALAAANLGIIGTVLMTALPCAVALFPQKGSLPTSALEAHLQKAAPTCTRLFFNKGL